MLVIVVTGGIGSGKTTATQYFQSKGAFVLDLDQAAHRLLEQGSHPYDEIVRSFGAGVLDSASRIDRSALARVAFASRESCAQLNKIMHPAVAGDILARLSELSEQPDAPSVVVLEVPLLVEAPEFAEPRTSCSPSRRTRISGSPGAWPSAEWRQTLGRGWHVRRPTHNERRLRTERSSTKVPWSSSFPNSTASGTR